jgi:hypothetical protein
MFLPPNGKQIIIFWQNKKTALTVFNFYIYKPWGHYTQPMGIYNLISKGTDNLNDFRARAVMHYLIGKHS